MKTLFCGLALSLLLSSQALALEFATYVFADAPEVAGVGDLDTQGVNFTVLVEQDGMSSAMNFTRDAAGGIYTSVDQIFTVTWDDTAGGNPSPGAWFDGTEDFRIKVIWQQTIHNPLINPYVTYTVDGDTGWIDVDGSDTTIFGAIDHDINGPY